MCVARMTGSYQQCLQLFDCFRTDICDSRCNADLDPGVAFLSQLTLEELVQFCVKDTIGNELAALRDSTLLSSHAGGSGAVTMGVGGYAASATQDVDLKMPRFLKCAAWQVPEMISAYE